MATIFTQPVTLARVADAANVSVSTASRALNGRADAYRISKTTAAKVRLEAERLGFQPSQIARSLQSQRSGLIGVIVPDISNPFFAAIAREVTVHAEANGFLVLLADSRDSTSLEVKLLGELLSRRVEGVVVCPVGEQSEHLDRVGDTQTPIVLVDRCFPNSPLTNVASDNVGGSKQAMKLLLNNGHTVIGCLQGLPGTFPNEQRLSAVRAEMRKAGLPFDDTLIAGDNFTEHSGYASAKRLLLSRPDMTAIFAFSTPNAYGGLRAAEELGWIVPDTLSFVTFDDSSFADFLRVPFATVSQNVQQLGQTAADVIVKQLKTGRRPRKKSHTVPVTLIPRHSIRKRSS